MFEKIPCIERDRNSKLEFPCIKGKIDIYYIKHKQEILSALTALVWIYLPAEIQSQPSAPISRDLQLP